MIFPLLSSRLSFFSLFPLFHGRILGADHIFFACPRFSFYIDTVAVPLSLLLCFSFYTSPLYTSLNYTNMIYTVYKCGCIMHGTIYSSFMCLTLTLTNLDLSMWYLWAEKGNPMLKMISWPSYLAGQGKSKKEAKLASSQKALESLVGQTFTNSGTSVARP